MRRRFEFTLSPEDAAAIERAAAAEDRSVASFLRLAAIERARRLNEQEKETCER